MRSCSSSLRNTLAGTPAAIQLSGISRFTTAPAATMQFFPIVTPPQIVALEHIQLPSPILIGFAYSRSWKPSGYSCGRRSSDKNGWQGVAIVTFAPIHTPSPSSPQTAFCRQRGSQILIYRLQDKNKSAEKTARKTNPAGGTSRSIHHPR